MFQATQWVKSPEGASGSWTTRARELVPSGGEDQVNGGEAFSPSQECFLGIGWPSSKAELVSSKSAIMGLIFPVGAR
jgi:hypothetical protein